MNNAKAKLTGELIGCVIAYVVAVRAGQLPSNNAVVIMASILDELAEVDPYIAGIYTRLMHDNGGAS